jgi:hypothetical protein
MAEVNGCGAGCALVVLVVIGISVFGEKSQAIAGVAGCARSPERTRLHAEFPGNREKYRENLEKRTHWPRLIHGKGCVYRCFGVF